MKLLPIKPAPPVISIVFFDSAMKRVEKRFQDGGANRAGGINLAVIIVEV